MHKEKKKLALRRESLRELDAAQASEVAGGRPVDAETNFISVTITTTTIVFIPTPAH